jgi:hypothetical protein
MPTVMQAMVEMLKPEPAHFDPGGGNRTAFIIVKMDDSPHSAPGDRRAVVLGSGRAHGEVFSVMDRNDLERSLSALANR